MRKPTIPVDRWYEELVLPVLLGEGRAAHGRATDALDRKLEDAVGAKAIAQMRKTVGTLTPSAKRRRRVAGRRDKPSSGGKPGS